MTLLSTSVRLRSLVAVIVLVGATSACAPKRQVTHEGLREKVSKYPLSQALSTDSTLTEVCEEQEVMDLSATKPKLDLEHVDGFWRDCQRIYACSPTAAALARDWQRARSTFRIGFAPLRSMGEQPLGENLMGSFFPGSPDIYLDDNINNQLVACTVLLHELVHRNDPRVTEHSLRSEFLAYWNQEAFWQELRLRFEFEDDEIEGRKVKRPRRVDSTELHYQTNETLMTQIADDYKFGRDYGLAQSFPKLPLERHFGSKVPVDVELYLSEQRSATEGQPSARPSAGRTISL